MNRPLNYYLRVGRGLYTSMLYGDYNMEKYERFKIWAQQNPNYLLLLSLGSVMNFSMLVGGIVIILAKIGMIEIPSDISLAIFEFIIWCLSMIPISAWALEIKGRSKWWLILSIAWWGIVILVLLKNNNREYTKSFSNRS